MSLDSLALQVLLPGVDGTSLEPDVARLLEGGLGGVCLFAGNMPPAQLTHAVRDVAPQAVIAVDEEGGDVTRLYAGVGSPVLGPAALGVVDDVDLTRATAASIGAELAAQGITMNLAPVADVNSDPRNPIIGVRSFGTDPHLVARHVAAYVSGLQAAGVAACAKHFPGHGDTHEDSHLALPRVEAPLGLLERRELVPFAAAVRGGAAAVMTSHIVVTALDTLPATLSAPVLRLLRDDLGFDGVVVSDALDMAGASAGRGIPAAAVEALRAGCDLLCIGAGQDVALVRAIQGRIVAAVRAGELSEQRLVEAAERLRRLDVRPAGTGPAPSDPADQLSAARRALRIDGELPDLTGALLARLETTPSIAAGVVPWGLPADEIDPAVLETSRPVVLQVRDAHRHPEVLALVDKLGPDALVVDYGWPGPWTARAARVCTFGASVPAREAVRALLAERGWRS